MARIARLLLLPLLLTGTALLGGCYVAPYPYGPRYAYAYPYGYAPGPVVVAPYRHYYWR